MSKNFYEKRWVFCFFSPARISEWRTKITVAGWFDNGSRVKLGFLLPPASVPACFDLVLMLYSSWLPARTKKDEKRLPVSWKHRLERPGVNLNHSCDVQLNQMRQKVMKQQSLVCVWLLGAWLHQRSISLDDLSWLVLSCFITIAALPRTIESANSSSV